jgi:hypothetical protein
VTLYKTLNGNAGAYGHGDYTDYMPHGKRPGKWLPAMKPVLCESGYHYCRNLSEVIEHMAADLYEVEVRGEDIAGDDKGAAEQMRLLRRIPEWNETTARLFAVDCARIAVIRYAYADQRELLHACLDTVVGWAEGGVDDAAYNAAYDAAHAAAHAAARAAAYDAHRAAAHDAARAAAYDAARAAAYAAAYDAAYDAARAAAHDAARAAAYDAARAAAYDAARAAAYAAAYDAARAEQVALLARYLSGEQGPFVEATS